MKQAVGLRCAEHETASDQLDELANRGFNVKSVRADMDYRDWWIEPHVARVTVRRTPGLFSPLRVTESQDGDGGMMLGEKAHN